MNANKLLKNVAARCIDRCNNNGEIQLDLDEMWRGRARVFFSSIVDLCDKRDLQNDLSILWDINGMATICDQGDRLWQYLINLPGFVFGEPVHLRSVSQHYWLLGKFNEVILSSIYEQEDLERI